MFLFSVRVSDLGRGIPLASLASSASVLGSLAGGSQGCAGHGSLRIAESALKLKLGLNAF
jgi:hypothetical protein